MAAVTTAAPIALRPDAYYAEVEGGVYFLSHQGETFIAGASVHQWLDRLAPLLDGTRTLVQLTDGLPAERVAFVTRLVETLIGRGLVRAVGPAEPDTLTAAERDEHSGELSFIGYFRDSAGRVFEDFRDTPVLVIGSGALVAETARACAAAGLRKVNAVTVGQVDALETALTPLVSAAQLVLHVADRPEPERAVLLERLCAAARAELAQVMPAAGGIWWQPAARTGGWSSAWRRHTALAGGGPVDVPVDVPVDATVDPVAIRVAASQAAHDVFRLRTGLRADARPRLVVLDPVSLGNTTHPLAPHPFDLPAAVTDETRFVDRMIALAAAPALSETEFSRLAAEFMDSTVGLFAEIDEGDLAQLPLHVTATTVSDPVGLLGSAPRPVATGAGLTFEQARYRAALAALACVGSLTVDPRLLRNEAGCPWSSAPPEQGLPVLGHETAWVGAFDLVDYTPRLVPAATAFPALSGPAAPYRAPLGAVAGYSWTEAVAEGMVAHAAALTLAGITQAPAPFGRIDPTTLSVDPELEYCLAMVDALNEELTLYDVTGPLGVPTVVGMLSAGATAHGAGLTHTAAAATCLRDLVLIRQAEVNGQPIYAPPRSTPVELRLRGDWTVSTGGGCSVEQIVKALAEQGHRPLAVPLDHDPTLHAALPFIVQVVCQ